MSRRVRCAIYTRKSTEEGLEQAFNSLDAQREACEAYIRSQAGIGWQLMRTRYDDGGISGGTMERPALQRLIDDIQNHRIDTVVVYKVDRLTRSLADFAKIVEVFDDLVVSFVSITQQFNTTTSMGRLTLNMLLSFAQFEREVTAERIRDKIAASRKKGLWMGGLPPLGYDVQDRKLVINPAEAETVRTLFRLYLECGTVKALLAATRQHGLVTKRRRRRDGTETGGLPFSRGHLYQLLANPLYIGAVVHKGVRYPGQHEAIIDHDTFEAVRRQLHANAAERRAPINTRAPSLLTGLVYDETGDRLCPTHASKKGRRYRYYISRRLMHRADSTVDGWRLPAQALENAVRQALAALLRDRNRMADALRLPEVTPDRLRATLQGAAELADRLDDPGILRPLLSRVTLSPDALHLAIQCEALRGAILGTTLEDNAQQEAAIEVTVPIELRRRGVEAKLILRATKDRPSSPDDALIATIARAYRWFNEIATGTVASINDIARRDRIHPSDIGRVMPVAFLAPDIVEAVLSGRQPLELTAKRLRRIGILPLEWHRQRRLLGVPD